MRKTRRTMLLAALLAAVMMPTAAGLSAASVRALTDEQREAVSSISEFLNSFRTLKGEFTQISPRGRVSTGRFYISKPGRMRFEYSPPVPIVIVSDGTWVAIRNNRRDTVDYYPLSRTPLRMVLAPRVNLEKDAVIHRVERRDGLLIVTLRDKDRMVPGKLVLVFDEGRRMLQQWIIVDGQGRRTTVSLGRMAMNGKVSEDLFRVARPGQGKKVRKKTNFRSAR